MTDICQCCLRPAPKRYHPACLRQLFGTPGLPRVDVDIARLHTAGLAMVGRTTLSGVQPKISLGLSADRQTLRVEVGGLQYILKPPSERFPALPENERLSLRILEAVGVAIPPLGLVPLSDGTPGYLVRRFDRRDGIKVRQEDFCQLAVKPPKDKYTGSAELCAQLVQRYAAEPTIELRHLFRRLVAGWLIGDGDLHLKNLSVLADPDGRYRLSPAYDAVCTRIYISDDRLALPVRGRDDQLQRIHWLGFAEDSGLPRRAAARVLDQVMAARDTAQSLVAVAGLPNWAAESYRQLLDRRFDLLAT
jgi:serine/threonine-protein kinase HipA